MKKPTKYLGSNLTNTVALFKADEVRRDGTCYTAKMLRAQAENNDSFVYDEKTQTLYFRMPSRLEAQPAEEARPTPKVPKTVREITPTPEQQFFIDSAVRDFENDTNAKHPTAMVEYTKVWAFLRTIIQADSLKACVLLDALNLASRVSNDELVQLSDYNESSKMAHQLMETYFLRK